MSRGKRKQYLEEVNASLAARAARESGISGLNRGQDSRGEFVVINDKENMWRIVPTDKVQEYMRYIKEQRF